ncbi:MAG: 30S ribosomal protein S6 [Candidatus Omnitrophota bacterium]
MNKYEAMFIIKPDLNETDRTAAMRAIKDQIAKQQGTVTHDEIWAERRKLAYDLFPLGGQTRFKEGMYYLVHFTSDPLVIQAVRHQYHMNESILRFIILRCDEKKKA